MTRFFLCLAAIVSAASLAANTCDAAIIVSTVVAPGSSITNVNAGDSVTADIFMELTGPSDVAAFNFAVQYDTSELTFVSRQEFQFGNLDFQNPNNPAGANGFVRNIDGATFSPQGTFAPFGPVRIASLVFTANSPIGDATDIDILPGIWDPLEDAFFSSNFQDVTTEVAFTGASVTAVPEPGSIIALSSVAGIGALLRRRSRKKSAESM